jgi:hypothetical protein
MISQPARCFSPPQTVTPFFVLENSPHMHIPLSCAEALEIFTHLDSPKIMKLFHWVLQAARLPHSGYHTGTFFSTFRLFAMSEDTKPLIFMMDSQTYERRETIHSVAWRFLNHSQKMRTIGCLGHRKSMTRRSYARAHCCIPHDVV